jgi:hypothetical protein
MSERTTSALAGLGYGTLLLLWALLSFGFGHGTPLPLGLVGSPFSLFFRLGFLVAPLWWAGIGYAIGRRSGRTALVLIALHALGAAMCLVRGTLWESFDRQWTQLGQVAVVLAPFLWPGFAVYLAGLVVACRVAFRQMEARA